MAIFSADITLIEDPDDGLRIEAPDTFFPVISSALTAGGLRVVSTHTAVPGTRNIPSVVSIAVASGTFDAMKTAVYDALVARGIKVSEENFSALGEKNIRLNLDDVSVFR